jgi:hypothetical protein
MVNYLNKVYLRIIDKLENKHGKLPYNLIITNEWIFVTIRRKLDS